MAAISTELLCVYPSSDAWRSLCDDLCPGAMQQLRVSVGPENVHQFVLVPVHPLNVLKLRVLLETEFTNGRIVLLPVDVQEQAVVALPTLSFRTLLPLGQNFKGYRIKLPVPVEATSLPRYVSP